jgi:predicted transcriptional regulator
VDENNSLVFKYEEYSYKLKRCEAREERLKIKTVEKSTAG